MKRICKLLVVILFLSHIINAQTNNSGNQNQLPKYIAQNTAPYYSEQLKWFQSKPVLVINGFERSQEKEGRTSFKRPLSSYISKTTKPSYYTSWLPSNPSYWVSKVTRSKKTRSVKPENEGLPSYISYSSEPYYSDHKYWQFSEKGILQDSSITASQKRKQYGKDQFITLKRHYLEGREKETLAKAISALHYSPLNADTQQEIELFNFIASFCNKYELFNEAESFYKSALARQLLEPELFNYATISLNLAESLNKQRKYDESIKYASFALTEYANAGNRDGIATCNLLIADNYYSRGDLLVAEKIILTKVLSPFSYVGNQNGRMACFEKLGHIYSKLNRNSEAKWFFIQQNMLADNQGVKIEQFNSLVDLGRTKISIGDYKLALKDLREAHTYLNSNSSIDSRLKLEEAYCQLFQKQGNKKLSKLSSQKCKKLKASIAKNQTAQKKAAYKLLNFSKELKEIYFASNIATDI